MIDKQNITGIILSGGKSSRMGIDKALLVHQENTFMSNVITAMTPFVDDIMIISDNPDHDQFRIRREEDFIKDAGPLSGLLTGLYKAKCDYVLTLSCDIPLISEDVISTLIEQSKSDFEVNQIESEGKSMPLIAIYKKSCWPTIFKVLQSDERRLRVAVKNLKTNTIELNPEFKKSVQNINTKQQFEALVQCR